MAQYIPKMPLVAEIDKRLHQLTDAAFDSMIGRNLIEIKDLLNTLEVKEVDLDKEVYDYINEHFSECDDGVLISDANSRELTLLDITPLAKHFFELGLKAQKGE